MRLGQQHRFLPLQAPQQMALLLLQQRLQRGIAARLLAFHRRDQAVSAQHEARRSLALELRLRQHARDRSRARSDALRQQVDLGPVAHLVEQQLELDQALERAGLALTQSAEQHGAAQPQLEQARQALRDAELGPQRVRTREAELAVTRSRLDEARAAVAEVQSALDDLTLRAPVAGTVTARFVNLESPRGART